MRHKVEVFLAILVSAVIFNFIFKIDMRSISVDSLIEESEVNENDVSNKKKVIYLTFDDGPSYKVTGKILDILEEKEVKATFFVIGNQIEDKEDVLKRMNECRDEINRVVGISPNIIRFPGGSYKHLNKEFLNRLHENNLKVYDWNLDNSDGLNPKQSKDVLYKNAIKGSKDLKTINLLMHCTDMNKNTSEALTKIIDYYKNQGYEFKTIEEDTPEMYFRIS